MKVQNQSSSILENLKANNIFRHGRMGFFGNNVDDGPDDVNPYGQAILDEMDQ